MDEQGSEERAETRERKGEKGGDAEEVRQEAGSQVDPHESVDSESKGLTNHPVQSPTESLSAPTIDGVTTRCQALH